MPSLLVSAQSATPLTAQNFTPPLQPQPGFDFSVLAVLLAAISLWSTTRFVIPSPSWYALIPYWPLSARQLSRITLFAPAMSAAPALSTMLLFAIVLLLPESWFTTPWSSGEVKLR